MKRGWIALDIDGTITTDKYSVPKKVIGALRELSKNWQIMILTGRTATFASRALSGFDFPFLFSAQNGSVIFEMPEKKMVLRRDMKGLDLEKLDEAFQDSDSDYLVYAGYDKGDYCTYRPESFSEDQIRYINDLKTRQKEDWHGVDSFDPNHFDRFPLVKAFGTLGEMTSVARKLKKYDAFELALMKDPFGHETFILLITSKGVNKGSALLEARKQFHGTGPIIAAGDDDNDVSMLAVADHKITMPTAPDHLKEMADLVAPAVEEYGILFALDHVLEKSKSTLSIGIFELEVFCIIGCLPHERHTKQPLIITLEVDPLESKIASDQMDASLDYRALVSLCKKECDVGYLLIEYLAQSILDRLFSEFSISRATLEIKKPKAVSDVKACFVRLKKELL